MEQSDQSYTLEDYLASIKRRRRVLFMVAVPILVVAVGLALSLPDVYRSVARMSVDLEGSSTQTLEPIQVSVYADQYVAELRDRVLSRDNLMRFLEESGDTFAPYGEDLSEADRLAILSDGFYFGLDTQPVTSERGSEVDIISGFRAGYAGPYPEFAMKAGQFFADSFLREDRRRRTETASSTATFLEKQIAETERRFAQYEQEMAEFKTKNACCLPELKELNMAIIQRAERDIETLQPRIRSLEQNHQFLQSQLEEIRSQTGSRDRLATLEEEYLRLVANYGPDHPDVARVRREIQAITEVGPLAGGSDELTQLRMQLAEAERRYSDIHPDVVSLKKRITALEAEQPSSGRSPPDRLLENPRYLQLRTELNHTESELAELNQRLPELRNRIEEHERRLTRTPQIETEYLALTRKLDTARETFDNLQRRLVIAQQSEALESTDIGARLNQLRGAGLPTSPSGPPRLAIMMLGAFLAGSLGIGVTIVAEMLDSTIRSSKDIVNVLQAVPIASIPVIQNSASRAASRRNLVMMTSMSVLVIAGIAFFVIRNMA